MDPVEAYLEQLRAITLSGVGVPETSSYPALSNLLNEVGKTLKPKVRCVIHPSDVGAGLPDGGLFTADQLRRTTEADALAGQVPSRGAIEVKPASEDVEQVASTTQVARYLARYRQVLVTNLREFALFGLEPDGRPVRLEHISLAADERAFWDAIRHPRAMAQREGPRLVECLRRVMLHAAPLAAPQDVAAFLASYARDARARIEHVDLPALATLRSALEESLAMHFEGEKGEHFFRSTLVQTLFYGVFSAWVLWAREQRRDDRTAVFDWRTASWSIELPVLRTLFHQISSPMALQPLDLVELVDSACRALNRVDRVQFFQRFEEGLAVQYFYEPFLEAFDPELRKQLGVWYTPREIVQYQVARVDTVLREELDVADGLADPNVVVLDPCCGTGTYLVEVLKRVAATLKEKGGDALLANDLKRAAQERIFGFEILPASFVVAHLQLGLLLANLGAPLGGDHERVGVYLTNALTGWEPPTGAKQRVLPFPDLEEEREAAEHVKRDQPILVILGNPPYNGFAGVAVAEERDLTNAYRTTTRAPKPQGQGLNDLYVRFFRMAERKIVEGTGRGVVCFISNYSWLDGLSFTGMREHFLDVFDRIWIDCLNGDKYKTGKLTPEGEPDPSVFSSEWSHEGIQVGTSIAALVRSRDHQDEPTLEFRHLWGKEKLAQLGAESLGIPTGSYTALAPEAALGYPLTTISTGAAYLTWPLLPELIPTSFPGVQTGRDLDLVEIDLQVLQSRMRRYFDPSVEDGELQRETVSLMVRSERFDPTQARRELLSTGISSGAFVRFAYRPFDDRHLYWHAEAALLERPREDLLPACASAGGFLTSRQKGERQVEGTPFYVTRHLPDRHLTRPGSACFPRIVQNTPGHGSLFGNQGEPGVSPNLSGMALHYLTGIDLAQGGGPSPDANPLWFHALATGHSRTYLSENSGALWQDWPRIPLPASRDLLEASAALGCQVAALLDTEAEVAGVTTGTVRPELRVLGGVASASGGALNPAAGDLAVTAGWGHPGKGGITMPGKGRLLERAYTAAERDAIGRGAAPLGLSPEQAFTLLGETCCDVFLNELAYWRCVPANVWTYTIGGYQVIKKWLSYRERDLLGRDLTADEVRHVTAMTRRIAALLLLSPTLDASYHAIKANTYDWPAVGSRQ
ncbi:MAG: N-6 DNA methylase [Acidobacteria bacterium]|nr:N-6 DNA methylase [Acidobacteriota bacterium]